MKHCQMSGLVVARLHHQENNILVRSLLMIHTRWHFVVVGGRLETLIYWGPEIVSNESNIIRAGGELRAKKKPEELAKEKNEHEKKTCRIWQGEEEPVTPSLRDGK